MPDLLRARKGSLRCNTPRAPGRLGRREPAATPNYMPRGCPAGHGVLGSDSEAGTRFAERLLTVVATCRQQARPLLD
jgi:hypothetical protein